MSASLPPPKDSFLLLQVWRALAAFIVLLTHAQHEASMIAAKTGQVFNNIEYPGGAGVDIFFVISGFVIFHSSRNLAGTPGAAKVFILRRLVRIVPLYWLFTTLMIIALALFPSAIDSADWGFWHFVQSYLFIPHHSPHSGSLFPVLSLGWTLNYEMYFYAVFAALLFLPVDKLMVALIAFFLGTVMLAPFVSPGIAALHFWMSPIVLEFLAGAIIAWFKIRKTTLPPFTLWLLAGAGGVMLLSLGFFPDDDYPITANLIEALAGISLVAAATLPGNAGSLTPPRLLSALGDSSYALYLSHPFTITVMKILWLKTSFLPGLSLWLYVAVTMTAAMAGAHIFYLLIEKPATDRLKFFVKRHAQHDGARTALGDIR